MLPYQLSIQTDQGIDHSEEGDHSKNMPKPYMISLTDLKNYMWEETIPTSSDTPLVHHPPESSPYLDAITRCHK